MQAARRAGLLFVMVLVGCGGGDDTDGTLVDTGVQTETGEPVDSTIDSATIDSTSPETTIADSGSDVALADALPDVLPEAATDTATTLDSSLDTATDAVSDSRDATADVAPLTKRVFVTSVRYAANLGGLVGADAKCQTLATTASLVGTFRAFLSDSALSAASRLTMPAATYKLAKSGTMVADSAATFFSNSHLAPIHEDENGINVGSQGVWTGSGGSGIGSGGCSDWTATTGSATVEGLSGFSDARWASAYVQYCDRTARLYCIEQ